MTFAFQISLEDSKRFIMPRNRGRLHGINNQKQGKGARYSGQTRGTAARNRREAGDGCTELTNFLSPLCRSLMARGRLHGIRSIWDFTGGRLHEIDRKQGWLHVIQDRQGGRLHEMPKNRGWLHKIGFSVFSKKDGCTK
jgi:hypothetical protein